MTLNTLKEVLDAGTFHHATYRTEMAEGLHIYVTDEKGFRGFKYVGYFPARAPECKEARELVARFGTYENKYR